MNAQKEINELFNFIDESELILSDRINFDDDNEDKIYIVDEEAVVESMKFIYSSRSSYDIFCWLKENNFLK